METESSTICRKSTISTIGKVTAGLVMLLSLGAFVLSFEALRDLAVMSGALQAKQAWVFPLIVDGSIIIFSLSALRASLVGEDRRWYMALVTIVTLASVAFNIAHARGGILSCVMAAMPPVLLFAAFESLMRQLFSAVAPQIKVKPPAKAKARQSGPTVSVQAETNDRRTKVVEMFEQGHPRKVIAQQLGISPATVSRYISAQTKGQLKIV